MPALSKPQSAGSAILTGNLGDGGDEIFFKVQQAQFNISTPVKDTTGDGDTFPTYDHASELRAKISMRGFMLANNQIGLDHIKNGTDNPFSVVYKLETGKKYTFTMMITNVIIDWNRVGTLIGVAIQGVMSGSDFVEGTP